MYNCPNFYRQDTQDMLNNSVFAKFICCRFYAIWAQVRLLEIKFMAQLPMKTKGQVEQKKHGSIEFNIQPAQNKNTPLPNLDKNFT